MPNALVLPPLTLYLGAALGLLLVRAGRKRLGWWVFAASAVTLVLLSTPLVAALLLRPLEVRTPLDPAKVPPGADAIVVLGGGMEASSPEYGRGSLDAMSLERTRYGAFLARATGLPLLTSGGVLREGADAVGVEMARVLTEELGVDVRWVEDRARNTWENAERTRALTAADGVDHVLVVSHAWHLPRALWCFEQHGLEATPAPTRIEPAFELELGAFVPSAKGLRDSSHAVHELLGLVAYRLGIR